MLPLDQMPRMVIAWQSVVDTTAAGGTPAVIAPQTPTGRTLETLLVALGYALFLVPVGIVAVELRRARAARHATAERTSDACSSCGVAGHAADAAFCRRCGRQLARPTAGARP